MPTSTGQQPIIAICGAGQCGSDLAAMAEAVGHGIAVADTILICGPPNAAVLMPIASGMREARNVIIVRTAAVVIAVGGEYGTLSDIALARKIGRTAIGLKTWELGRDIANQPHVQAVDTPEHAIAVAGRQDTHWEVKLEELPH